MASLEQAINAVALAIKENSTGGGATLQEIYPIGSLYINTANNTNPNTLFGFGTWVRFGEGRVLVSEKSTDSDFTPIGKTGGQKDVQSHSHGFYTGTFSAVGGSPNALSLANFGSSSATLPSGSGSTNMNPYIAVVMWTRTA